MTESDPTLLLDARGLHKRFGDKEALRGLDLSIGVGEIVGFIGPNGAGKSTCFRICLGLSRPTSGSVSVFGMNPVHEGTKIRGRCVYLPGETSIYHQMTGVDYLKFARHGYSIDPEFERLGEDLFDVPLKKKIRGYSAGMKQRLALRGALTTGAEMFILDEPDRALDASARLRLRELLVAKKDRGCSILLSSHHLSEIEAIADRSEFVLNGTNIPSETIHSAREELRNEIRLRLRREIEVPTAGTVLTEQAPDGSLRIRTLGNPLEWLSQIPHDAVEAAEIGATRLEDIYRNLTEVAPR